MPGTGSSCRYLWLALLMAALPLGTVAAELTADHAAKLRTGHYLWEAEGATGQIRIVIDRAQQRAFVYRGELLVGVSTISTGKKGHTTPLGTFTILQKAARHRSNKYSNAPMPFMQRLTWDGIALHAGPLPGYPASHGCIRLPWAFAQKLFALTSLGATVEITDTGPQLPRVQMAAAPKPAPSAPVPAPVAVAAAAPALAVPASPPVIAAVPPPVILAQALPAERPRPASWREKSAEDYVTWGTILPPGRPNG